MNFLTPTISFVTFKEKNKSNEHICSCHRRIKEPNYFWGTIDVPWILTHGFNSRGRNAWVKSIAAWLGLYVGWITLTSVGLDGIWINMTFVLFDTSCVNMAWLRFYVIWIKMTSLAIDVKLGHQDIIGARCH